MSQENSKGVPYDLPLESIPFQLMDRIAALEFLDETEELDLVLAHYAISWGLFVATSDQHKYWDHWGLSQKAED